MQFPATKRAIPRAPLGGSAPDRRRRIRHRIHTPAYARLEPASHSKALDLSTILDISEDGMAIQATAPLEIHQQLDFSLDCSETQGRIPMTGVVVWCDGAGRAGVCFHKTNPVDQALQEWQFFNLLVAVAHHTAAGREDARGEDARGERSGVAESRTNLSGQQRLSGRSETAREKNFRAPAAPDYTGLLAALDAVKREVEALGTDLDAGLRLIAGRALVFTNATGAAIGIAEMQDPIVRSEADREMVCRARAGSDAPGLGARLQVGSGFSGECVRTGRLLYCEDAETDSRVDWAICRGLGVRSMVAVPVRSGNFVAGLLEVFSPQPNAFSANQCSALQRLADTASFAIHRAAQAVAKANALKQQPAANAGAFPPVLLPADRPARRPPENDPDVPTLFGVGVERPALSGSRRILLFAVALTLIGVVVWLVKTWPASGPRPAVASHQVAPRPSASPAPVVPLAGIAGLRQMAQQGDAASQFALGVHYATGEEVPQDYTEAVRWFSMAAQQGQAAAQATLGAYYWAGRGVPQDMEKAYFWAILAQAGGDQASKVRVAFLASRMTRAQVVAAQQRANDWIKERELASDK